MAALRDVIDAYQDKQRVYPMIHYALGFYLDRLDQPEEAAREYALGAKMPPEFCFPFRLEEIAILRHALERRPYNARAHYYLGDALYDAQPTAAIAEWERAKALDSSLAMARRNLALAYARRENNLKKAMPELEAAFALRQDPRWMYELDELRQSAGVEPRARLAFFEKYPKIAFDRDDVLTRQIMLQVQTGDYDGALKLLGSRKFNIWEGASLSAQDWYVDAHLLRGHRLLKAGRPPMRSRITWRRSVSENLGVGKPYHDNRERLIEFYIGAAHDAAGNSAKAKEYYQKAAAPVMGRAHRSRRVGATAAEVSYHQGLALARLGDKQAAAEIFNALVASGRQLLAGGGQVNEFAKFGERTAKNVADARAHYIVGLGQFGSGNAAAAHAEFGQAVKLDVNQLWAAYYLGSTTKQEAR